jgi:TPR repeat protein
MKMATREQISLMRSARNEDPNAQLGLGSAYLFGQAGLKSNLLSALYWLHRAAGHGQPRAWQLIGAHIPYATVSAAPEPMRFCIWYERAYLEGVPNAALVMAKLILNLRGRTQSMHEKAVAVLKDLAGRDDAEAQWMLAQELKAICEAHAAGRTRKGDGRQGGAASEGIPVEETALRWAVRAAENGIRHARQALADRAWRCADYPGYLQWALPAARAVVHASSVRRSHCAVDEKSIQLVSRSAIAFLKSGVTDVSEAELFLQFAAHYGDLNAQYLFGTWCANLDEEGQILAEPKHRNRFKKAVYWLTLACEKGDARAWYALYKIYTRPNSGLYDHSMLDAQRCIERAAELGHPVAQWELGAALWRARRARDANDVRASFWLQKAAAQGSSPAEALLGRMATLPAPASWAQDVQRQLAPEVLTRHPLLAARIALAARFGLSRQEALLLDINAADHGHCLVVDIRSQYARSKRRLILLQTGDDRLALTRIARHFTQVDSGPGGPEGNYRKRHYLLSKVIAAGRTWCAAAPDRVMAPFAYVAEHP